MIQRKEDNEKQDKVNNKQSNSVVLDWVALKKSRGTTQFLNFIYCYLPIVASGAAK